MDKKNTYCVILAGGVGSRFWPMSTTNHPKQFHDILGVGRTLIQQTYDRLLSFCNSENIYVITDGNYIDLVKEQIPELNIENIIGEPVGMNTAPCALYSAMKIYKKNPKAEILVCPSDHLILNEERFTETVLLALKSSKENQGLYTLGIKPTRPDTGYGYIQYVESDKQIKKVKTFTEKPNLDLAEKFLKSGDFLWNSGIFIWSAKDILDSFKKYLPEMYNAFNSINDYLNTKDELSKVKEVYPTLQKVSIDVGIMEKDKNVYVIPSQFGWSDLGTWLSLYEQADKDDNKNAKLSKNIFTYSSNRNIIYTQKNKVTVIDKLEGYIVVDTNDALLISPIENSQKIKNYVTDIKLNKKQRHI
ncbi:mannose-1-phosphate guanylyltransferase [Weeksellaceae bacterium TAE3-ERU29]|nr:mannose-1-phosphate guanylyltransferase [Weeksellaceae bacterium TAE3-ERU29]